MSSWQPSMLSRALDQRHHYRENRDRLLYLLVHFIIGIPLFIDINKTRVQDDSSDELFDEENVFFDAQLRLQVEQTVLFLVLVNAVFLCYKWLKTHLELETNRVELSERQMRMLKLDPNQSYPGLRLKSENSDDRNGNKSPFPLPPAEVTLASASDMSRSLLQLSNMSNLSMSMMDVSSNSWLAPNASSPVVGGARDRPALKVSPSRLKASPHSFSMGTNDSFGPSMSFDMRTQQSKNNSVSFLHDSAALLNVSEGYQVSTPILHTSGDASMNGSMKTSNQGLGRRRQVRAADVCRKLKIDASKLDGWVERLRIWISETILKRLVAEIDETNNKLVRLGLAEATIGDAGLERVKKCAQMPQVIASIPTLPSLLSFLDVTLDQRYLVSRIRSLSSTGAMSSFYWNSGDSSWNDKLPTDAEIILHLVAAYLDSQLPQMKGVIDGRSFSAVYLVKSPEKNTTFKSGFGIVQLTSRPPHFVFQVGDEQLELSAGRNNLFHTLLLFLHHIKRNESSMLGRLNLGLSGLNVLWVLE